MKSKVTVTDCVDQDAKRVRFDFIITAIELDEVGAMLAIMLDDRSEVGAAVALMRMMAQLEVGSLEERKAMDQLAFELIRLRSNNG